MTRRTEDTNVALNKLTPAERSRLGTLERTIRDGIATFLDVGRSLLEIRDAQLYRATHTTWEDYCRDRWGFSARHALRLITASEVATIADAAGADSDPRDREEIPPIQNERQARARLEELTMKAFRDMPPEEQAEVVRRNGAVACQRADADQRQDKIAKVCKLLARCVTILAGMGGEPAIAVMRTVQQAGREAARL